MAKTKIADIPEHLLREAGILKSEWRMDVYRRINEIDAKSYDCAERMGIAPASLDRILHSDGSPTILTMVRVADSIGCEIRIHMTPRP